MPIQPYTPQEYLSRTRESLSRDCGYSNKELGVSQAIMLVQTRDSDALDRSNWSVITADMQAQYGEESAESWHIERFHHWAVGWVEYLIVTVYSEDVPDENEKKILLDLNHAPVGS